MSTFSAINPSTNQPIAGYFENATLKKIDKVAQKAAKAFESYREKNKTQIASFLDQIADEILSLGDSLINRCHLETALPIVRLENERIRTINQLKLFANLVREGSWVDSRIDTADHTRSPFPKPDIRQILIPIGPVAVFGASNFPLAFSTAGGDTVSALASGCTVIVKAHEAHPGTSEMVANAILKAVEICKMPDGTFSLLQGNSNEIGKELVKHPAIKAVGFTGSFSGGKALFDYANTRPEPIPVFAEMGSTNPIFILPDALQNQTLEIASGLVNSVTMGVGQFCTKPGLTFIQKSEATEKLYEELKIKITDIHAGTMLTSNIKKAYNHKIEKLNTIPLLENIGAGFDACLPNEASPKLFKTSIENYFKHDLLSEEIFGPTSILIEANSKETILQAARNLKGHLTATVFATPKDLENNKDLLSILELKVGRLILNNYPTGVEVCPAIVHGGPFPSTTLPHSTSVGTGAIKRFTRPLCYQNYPDILLPEALKNNNPQNIWRLVNGHFSKEKIE